MTTGMAIFAHYFKIWESDAKVVYLLLKALKGGTCWGCKMLQPPGEPVWWFLKKLKLELAYDLAILLLVCTPKN